MLRMNCVLVCRQSYSRDHRSGPGQSQHPQQDLLQTMNGRQCARLARWSESSSLPAPDKLIATLRADTDITDEVLVPADCQGPCIRKGAKTRSAAISGRRRATGRSAHLAQSPTCVQTRALCGLPHRARTAIAIARFLGLPQDRVRPIYLDGAGLRHERPRGCGRRRRDPIACGWAPFRRTHPRAAHGIVPAANAAGLSDIPLLAPAVSIIHFLTKCRGKASRSVYESTLSERSALGAGAVLVKVGTDACVAVRRLRKKEKVRLRLRRKRVTINRCHPPFLWVPLTKGRVSSR
jgi:hypothetical protein